MSIYISSSLVLTPGALEQPLSHARIGYNNVITSAGLTGTAGVDGYPLSNVLNPATFERYKPTISTSATINIDALSAVDVDYMGLQHRGVTSVLIESSIDDITYTTQAEYNPTGNSVMALFETVIARYWRITLSGSGVTVVALKLGLSLAMQRSIFSGHTPITLSQTSAVRPNMSETGQFLGASIQRKGLTASYAWKNLASDWYRANFDKFIQSSPRVSPFFIAWKPDLYPNDVAYCLATNDVKPSIDSPNGFMSVSLSVEGFSDVA